MATDLRKVLAGLTAAHTDQIEAAKRALDEFGEHVLGDAQQLAPVGGGIYSPNDPAPGTLEASGVTEPARVEDGRIVKEIGFNTVYAAAQHEGLDFRHDQGEAKFLETAIRTNAPKLAPYVAKRMKELMP